MKIQVYVKVKATSEVDCMVDLTVNAHDQVSCVKERMTSSQMIPFTDQDVFMDGELLDSGKSLADSGVKEGCSLDLVVNATESALVQQLTDLLQTRDLSPDELGLLYCYKHGLSVGQALKMLGADGKLPDFIKKQKSLVLENGRVTLVREDTPLKPFSAADEIVEILKTADSQTMTVKELSFKFLEKFNTSISSVVGMRPQDFLVRNEELFSMSGSKIVSLKPPSPNAKSAAEPKKVEPPSQLTSIDSQQYMELHSRITTRAPQVTQALDDAVDAIMEGTCFNVHHVAKGGSAGKGTMISGVSDGEIVLFLHALPLVCLGKSCPAIVSAAVGMLQDCLGNEHGVTDIVAGQDCVRMNVKGLMNLTLRFAPAFDSYTETLQALASQSPEDRKLLSPALLQERTKFIDKQSESVKMTMRLMKWWRDQQSWSSDLTRPSDDILELVTIYAAVKTKPSDQRMAIANAMSLLSRFNELKVIWSNFYSKADVWTPLLAQRPLLMDPTNPYVNVADRQSFDASEVMSFAKTTHFFW